MWDNPRLLNAAAGCLVGMVLFASSIAALYWLLHSPVFPVRSVALDGATLQSLRHAPRGELEAVMARAAGGNFFAARIDELRTTLERLPWVRNAAVRRVWPDRLEVTIEEHVALARWGSDALVNTHGERFTGTVAGDLPTFSGPANTEAEMARRYRRFTELIAPLASPVERVVLSSRHAWQLTLANGLQLTLGRDADVAEQRLARFVAARTAPPAAAPAREVVDLRYPNGFAIRVKG